jgi:uncharacterized protein YegL
MNHVQVIAYFDSLGRVVSVPAAKNHAERAKIVIDNARYGEHTPFVDMDVVVHFANNDFDGVSFGLALALADKQARHGRAGQTGRLVATRVVGPQGGITAVDAFGVKLAHVEAVLGAGDVFVYPRHNVAPTDTALQAALQRLHSRGIVLHPVEQMWQLLPLWSNALVVSPDVDATTGRRETMTEGTRLEEAVEFAENPEPCCPCVLLLDTSGSMQGASLEALNQGLRTFRDDLARDTLAARRVEVAIVTFDSTVQVVQDFVTADQFEPPTLTAQGMTHMGSAIHKALDMIQARKAQYRAHGVVYYRPWVFMITDGAPQGEADTIVERAAQRLHEDEEQKHVAFFAVGVEDADMARLRQIVVRAPVKLTGLNFAEMFVWLSASMQKISQSKPEDQVALAPPGWGTV